MELFSVLDNALSQKAEDTLTEFAAVKKADVQLQTQLGNRQGQIAANVIGAFAESQNSAFGWQVRVFGAENDTKGANAGIFFRRVDGESLYGINTFADYEKGNYGEFLRYGIGGELQNRYASFAINYYLPITDDKHTGSTVAFSQKGYDANLRINIPQLDFLKVAADYYHYDGEYGLDADKGFRYGLEVQPINNLHIGVFYDDGGEKFGGDIVYVYNIAAPAKRESKDAFSPDLFAPIVREYSQRIITATTGPGISLSVRAIMTTFTTMTAELITRTTTFSTMAGVEVRTTTEMTVPSRRASVQFTVQYYEVPNLYVVVSISHRYLLTLPPMTTTRPWVITTMLNLRLAGTPFTSNIIVESNFQVTGRPYGFPDQVLTYTLTIVQGSEERIGMMTLTTRTTTTEDVITAMTMAMTMQGMATTMAMTAFLTTTITLGLPTTTIGAANVDSHLPPSFPLSSFPPSSPIMVSYGLAKNGDSWIPAMVVPALAPFPRHSRAPSGARMTGNKS